MGFDHQRHRAHLKRQSMVANGLRSAKARALSADSQARHMLGERYVEAAATPTALALRA